MISRRMRTELMFQVAIRTEAIELTPYQATLTDNSPSPATVAFSASPRFTGPTPSGVPVKNRSPDLSATRTAREAIVSGLFQIMGLMSPYWGGSPVHSIVFRAAVGRTVPPLRRRNSQGA